MTSANLDRYKPRSEIDVKQELYPARSASPHRHNVRLESRSFELTKPSELYFQQELELTRRTRSYRSCIQGQIYQAEVGSRNEAIRAGILRTVEKVEHFGPQLNLYPFSDRKGFGKRRINLPDPGTSQEIARNIAEPGGAG